jgi:hypothetical protein
MDGLPELLKLREQLEKEVDAESPSLDRLADLVQQVVSMKMSLGLLSSSRLG